MPFSQVVASPQHPETNHQLVSSASASDAGLLTASATAGSHAPLAVYILWLVSQSSILAVRALEIAEARGRHRHRILLLPFAHAAHSHGKTAAI